MVNATTVCIGLEQGIGYLSFCVMHVIMTT